MNIAGLIGIIVFYILILVVGIWAVRKKKPAEEGGEETDEIILAGRSIGCFVGTFTMTATWVGGGYINGTAELVYTEGMSAAQAPWGYAISLIIGGLLFARKMREEGHVTMLDPLQIQYGKIMGGILYLPALLGETFWSAAILGSLGATLSVVLEVHIDYAVIASACVAIGYTFFGGLYAVAFTDVVQLFCIFIGLWLTIPFALTHDNVSALSTKQTEIVGKIEDRHLGVWIDSALLLCLGGIPWQVYFQRVLSAKSAKYAQMLSFTAAFGCIIMALPAILIGGIAQATDWATVINDNSTKYLKADGSIDDKRLVLPLVLQYLTPTWVSFIGLGAVSAAVMSSADSSVLSASSMFSYNIYKLVIRQKASGKELIWVIRVGIFVVGAIATVMGLTIESIYQLWVLSSDLVFVLLFPQLLCAVYLKFVNVYGSMCAFFVGAVLRILGGESTLGIPIMIRYPFYDEEEEMQLFPFRTFAMGCSLLTLIVVSLITNSMFKSVKGTRKSPDEVDIIRISYNKEPEQEKVTSFSRISRWSGSYNNITASASEIKGREDKSLLKTTLTRTESARNASNFEM